MDLSDFKLDFTGRRVLITGGGRGMGKSHVRMFLGLNAQVFVLEKEADLVANLREEFPTVTTVQVDLTDWEATARAVDGMLPIHHLVNNAAIAAPRAFLDIDLAHFNQVVDINLRALLQVGQLVAKGMIQHGIKDGTIVNISSVADTVITSKLMPLPVMYAVSKTGVSMLTKLMASELAAHKIRVNYIRPGIVNTEMIESLPEEMKKALVDVLWHRQVLSDSKPMGPIEIGKGIAFLSSPLSAMMTGTGLTIDAGFCISE